MRRTGVAFAALLACFWSAAAPAETGAGCAPWPGEPASLPAAASDDPFLGRWISLRVRELAAEATAAEAAAPARAHRFWQHALCLDPGSPEAEQGAQRTRPIRVHRPVVVAVRTAQARETEAGFSQLGEPIRVVSVPVQRPPAPQPPAPDWKRLDTALDTAEARLRDADFETALASAERLRRDLGKTPPATGLGERKARAELVAATAEIALGREDAARRSFERALAANPALDLDPATTPPKVRRAFEAVRGEKGGGR